MHLGFPRPVQMGGSESVHLSPGAASPHGCFLSPGLRGLLMQSICYVTVTASLVTDTILNTGSWTAQRGFGVRIELPKYRIRSTVSDSAQVLM